MYANTQHISRLAATVPLLAAAPVSDWPGNIDDDPAYLAWLEEQSEVQSMRFSALAYGSRPGLSGVNYGYVQ